MALSDLCPAVILGDPLQAIFTFGGSLVDWQADLANFPQVQVPVFPWRWHQRNELLGEFLTDVRLRLENGQPINLAGSPVGWRANSPTETYGACMNAAGLPGDVVVLRKWPHEVPGLARRLGGAFGVMEELRGEAAERPSRCSATPDEDWPTQVLPSFSSCATASAIFRPGSLQSKRRWRAAPSPVSR